MNSNDERKVKLELRLENLYRNYRGCVAAQRHAFEMLIAEAKRDMASLDQPQHFVLPDLQNFGAGLTPRIDG